MLPDGKGTDLLREHSEKGGTAEFVVVTGRATLESAVTALRGGASDYLTKPIDVARLDALLERVRKTVELRQELTSLRGELRDLGRFGELIGASSAMQEVYRLIERVAPTSTSVLLIGESGTGKELAARTLHRLSGRRHGPLVPVNCGAISPNLMESELFGHEKGSFTGAARKHRGLFEQADGGTLFLDELTEMPVDLQVKLLRVLESSSVVRVGGDREISFDVRLLAGTNRDPLQAVEEGRLRSDLYYRLNVFAIPMPPLRDRAGDIELLAAGFLDRLNREEGESKRLSLDAIRSLEAHHWPGNVRELKNAIERAFILADDVIDRAQLPEAVVGQTARAGSALHVRVGTQVADLERRLILSTLEHTGGNKTQAAELLGLSRRTLYNKLKSFGGQEAD